MNKLYLISQDVNSDYDAYDSAVVCATSTKEAQVMFPFEADEFSAHNEHVRVRDWAPIEDVKVKFIGTTDKYTPGDVVISSLNPE